MSNRAERRASAKIARQAIRRARSPTEGAILRSAAAFVVGDPVDELHACLSAEDFDAAWERSADDLDDILAERYADFRTQAYAEACVGTLQAVDVKGEKGAFGTRLLLCPLSGSAKKIEAFASGDTTIRRLESSLREFGVVSENDRCLMFAFAVPAGAFAPEVSTPGRVRALHDYFRDRAVDRLAGSPPPSAKDIRLALRDLCGFPDDAPAEDFGALIGIEMRTASHGLAAEGDDDEFDAEGLARAAAVASWHDSYAADVPDVVIGAPLDWPACAAALAWEMMRAPMAAALLARGVPDGRPEIIHCAVADDGERFVASAVHGGVASGPFSAPSALVWMDADEFFARAEASAEHLHEHDTEDGVLAPLRDGAKPATTDARADAADS